MDMTENAKGADLGADAVFDLPVGWLHEPRTARQHTEIKGDQSKILPMVVVAAAGAITGGGLQLAGQALRKSALPSDDRAADDVRCMLSCREIREGVARMLQAKDPETSAVLQEIVDRAQTGKPFPIAAAVYLAGVAYGAAAARP